jgi:transcriptional regulator with XRE-family HTH domain
MNDLGATLLKLRTAAGLSLKEVSVASGRRITPMGLSLLERGDRKSPRLNTLEGLATALGLTITITPKGTKVRKEKR